MRAMGLKELAAICQKRRRDLTLREARQLVECLFEEIAAELEAGRPVRIHAFGTFVTHHRPARWGTIPGTDKKARFPAKNTPKLRPSTILLSRLNPARQERVRRRA